MKPCDVVEMQKSYYDDPSFFVEFCNVGRGFIKVENNKEHHIISTVVILVWKIVGEKLLPVESIGVFSSTETYLIQWDFKYKLIDNEIKISTIFFYWKGLNATKGLTPIPENFNNDNAIVERIVQWSEPAIFFHIFNKPLIITNNLDLKTRLFMVRGELLNEIHLIELPYLKKNLRSRGVFLIINNIIYIWRGLKITKELDLIIKKINFKDILNNNNKIVEIIENDEDDLFVNDSGKYYHVKEDCNFTPRLFYLNSITGEFLATEIKYPLRSRNVIAAFPFLQTHLITDQGLFLLDNNHEIWLIHNESENGDLGKKTANEYAKLKGKNIPVKVNTDVIEFTNIFPYWD